MKYPAVWVFNENRRVYPESPKGRLWANGGPIYREHWEKHKIVSETQRSWITEFGQKIPKSGGIGIAFSEQAVEDDVWAHEIRSKLADRIVSLKDIDLLRKIAELLP